MGGFIRKSEVIWNARFNRAYMGLAGVPCLLARPSGRNLPSDSDKVWESVTMATKPFELTIDMGAVGASSLYFDVQAEGERAFGFAIDERCFSTNPSARRSQGTSRNTTKQSGRSNWLRCKRERVT